VTKDDELLKAIGVALMHHNLFFLFPDSIPLKIIYIFFSLFFLNKTEARVQLIILDNRFDMIESMIKNFFRTWPLIYIVNHFSSMYLTEGYNQAMWENRKIQNELKKMNGKLQEANEKLNHTMALLEKKNEELNGALKLRELFIAGFSHELRNPLNSMLGNIELVRLEVKDEKAVSLLDTCKLCGEVLLALINNVLDVAKINAEKLELQYLPDNFLKMMEKVWGISTFRMKQKGLQGELYLSNNFPKYLEMDSHRFIQVLLNLLGNSAKFTKEGFIKVVISWHENQNIDALDQPHPDYLKLLQSSKQSDKTECTTAPGTLTKLDDDASSSNSEIEQEPEPKEFNISRSIHPKFLTHMLASQYSFLSMDAIKLRKGKTFKNTAYEKKKGIIKIEIIDTGCGISNSSLQKLFQPFCQADPSIARRFGGTGLGLYITKEIIQKMGGKIHVYSEENVGSDFCILVPASTASKKEAQVQACREESEEEFKKKLAAAKLKTLIVGEEMTNRVFADYMKKLSIETELLTNGNEVLNKLKGNKKGYYSFIIIDSKTSEFDGISVCKNIRKYEAEMNGNESIPIIMVSGSCTEQERIQCLDCKGDVKLSSFYRKPFTFGDCKRSIQIVLREKKLSSQRRPVVLAVDDDPFNTTVIKEFLNKNGFICDVCNNGKEALKKLKEGRYNAVLIDYEMPEMDGLTATSIIKKNYPELFVIGMTGNTGDEYINRGLISGMNRVELKPINFQKIIKTLLKETIF